MRRTYLATNPIRLDEIVVDSEEDGPVHFHIERMTPFHYWFCIRVGDEERHFNITSDSSIDVVPQEYE